MSVEMIDVQSSTDTRGISIQKVGIRKLRYPIRVLDKAQEYQSTIATVSMSVDLPAGQKGTHMSRFVEALQHNYRDITLNNLRGLLEELIFRLGSVSAHVEIYFPYFIEKRSPVSNLTSLMDYDCGFIGELSHKNQRYDSVLWVKVPVCSLCPCSRAISARGAHNQRSFVSISVRFQEFVWIEELVSIAESSASSALFALLKRDDEKFVTEQAFDNPVFVEDLVRNIAIKLQEDERITWFRVESENLESIHNHNAFAALEQTRASACPA